jgi:2,3-bisphosphoglycerate-independent phosphoglycerate mutase
MIIGPIVEKGGAILITADHGNAEQMVDEVTNQPLTSHTSNPVPVILVGKGTENLKLRNGVLKDVAPTILELMSLPKPPEMTGESLIIR